MSIPSLESLMTVAEAAVVLNVSPATVYALVSSGKMNCHRIGTKRGAIRISKDDIQSYLEASHETTTAKPPKRPPRRKLKHIKV